MLQFCVAFQGATRVSLQLPWGDAGWFPGAPHAMACACTRGSQRMHWKWHAAHNPAGHSVQQTAVNWTQLLRLKEF